MLKYKALDINTRQKIIRNIKKWKNQMQVAEMLWLTQVEVSKYLEFYNQQRIIDWRKYCRSCWSWKLANLDNFKSNSVYRKDWSIVLYSTCKMCLNRKQKNEGIMSTDKVVKIREKDRIRAREKRAKWLIRTKLVSEMTPEEYAKQITYRREYSRKRRLKLKQ